MNVDDNKIHFDIWGICVSRDVFGLYSDTFNDFDDKYIIENYFANCCPIVQFTDHCGPQLTISDLNDKVSNFYKKVALADYNKNIFQKLNDSPSNWIVIDLRVFTYGCIRIDYGGGCYEYVTREKFRIIENGLKNKGLDIKCSEILPNEFFNEELFLKFISNLKRKYGSKIILLETLESEFALDSDGNVSEIQSSNVEITSISNRLCYLFLKNTNCYFIKCPPNILADWLHKWGLSSVHYIYEYYLYAYHAIDYVMNNYDSVNVSYNLDLMYLECCAKISSIRTKELLSSNNSIKRAQLELKIGNTDQYIKIIKKMCDDKIPLAFLEMGRAYSKGIAVEKNIDLAIKWLSKAVENNVLSSELELFDLLLDIGTAESYSSMIELILPFAKKGQPRAIMRLARAYYHGYGVKKDLNHAAELMREASTKESWFNNELFDVLWDIGTPEAYTEMIEAIQPLVNKKDGNALARLANAYWKGKGVEKNLMTAIDLMELAIQNKATWAEKDLKRLKNELTENSDVDSVI